MFYRACQTDDLKTVNILNIVDRLIISGVELDKSVIFEVILKRKI